MDKVKRKRYAKDWEFISMDIRVRRAKNRCEKCGLQNHSVIIRKPLGVIHVCTFEELEQLQMFMDLHKKTIGQASRILGFIYVILSVAHLDRDTSNNDYSNLLALCQKCHLDYDRRDNVNRKLIKYRLLSDL